MKTSNRNQLILKLIIACICTVFIFVPNNVLAQSLPDLLDVTKPNPEPSLPKEFDPFTPPVNGTLPSSMSPIVCNFTKTAGPGESLAIIGANINNNTRFIVYGQTTANNGILLDAKVQKLDADKKAIVTLPELSEKLPDWTTYFIWLKNGIGMSKPVVINKTSAWWTGPEKVVAGQITAVHGTNLSHGNGTATSWVYIKPVNDKGLWAEIVSVNPYRVQFKVPTGLSNGNYEVWVHNGHGRNYGWSKSSNNLIVYNGVGWTNSDFNVKKYGAKGDGVTDDTKAIKDAIKAASSNPLSSVYFPEGTYNISSTINMSSQMRFRGDGMTKSIIRGTGIITVMVLARGLNTVEIKDLKIDESAVKKSEADYESVSCVDFFKSNNVWLTNTELFCGIHESTNADGWYGDGTPFGVQWDYDTTSVNHGLAKRGFFGDYIYLTGCKFTGFFGNGNMNGCRQVFIDRCDYYGRAQSDMVVGGYALQQFSVTNNTAQDYNTEGYNDAKSKNNDWTYRFIVQGTGHESWALRMGLPCSNDYNYIADNKVIAGAHRNAFDTNKGELILTDGSYSQNLGAPVWVDKTHVRFSDRLTLMTRAGYLAINRGKGEGQIRYVVDYDTLTKIATIDKPWDVLPDTSSLCTGQNGYNNYVAYHNYLENHDNYNSLNSASCGIQLYGNAYSYIAANNTIRNVGRGMSYWILEANDVVMNTMFINNDIAHVGGHGIYQANCGNGLSSFGNITRNNKFDDISGAGIELGSPANPEISIFEKNTFINSNSAFNFNQAWSDVPITTQSAFIYNNSFSGTGTAGIFSTNVTYDVGLQNNTYSGYTKNYSEYAPGAILELPYRFVELTRVNPTKIIQVWNSGSTSLNWIATKTAKWLNLSSTSGTILPEGNSGDIKITCNPKGLENDKAYVDIITITSGAISRTIRVTYNNEKK